MGALAITIAIRLASTPGYAVTSLLTDVAARLPDSQVRDRIVRFSALPEGVSPSEIADTWGSSGFVVDSVPLAIFAARDIGRRSLADVLQRAIEGGGDADTIGSMTGQIAGAAAGTIALPDSLVSRLRDRDQMFRTAETFAGVAVRVAQPARR